MSNVNVLGELFGNIASAIREQTGESSDVKIKPVEFPEKIRNIDTNSNDGSVWSMENGSFTPTKGIETVNHNLGVIPELIIVYIGAVPEADCLFFATGFNSAMTNLFDDESRPSLIGIILSTSGFLSLNSKQGIESNGDEDGYTGEQKGVIRNATTTTFTVGGSKIMNFNTGLSIGQNYYWQAYYKKPAVE